MVKVIQRGDNPVDVLTQLKTEMQKEITAAGQSPDSELKVELAQKAVKMHVSTMGALSKIYPGKIERVEQLKQDIRSLYEKAQNQVERYQEQLKASQPRPAVAGSVDESVAAAVAAAVAESVGKINILIGQFRTKALAASYEENDPAFQLAMQLSRYGNQYAEAAKSDPSSAAREFIEQATTAINEARPELEQRGLGWGDYLTNLVKQFVNAVTTFVAATVHSGASAHQGFFTLKRSESAEAAQELEDNINDSETPIYGR